MDICEALTLCVSFVFFFFLSFPSRFGFSLTRDRGYRLWERKKYKEN